MEPGYDCNMSIYSESIVFEGYFTNSFYVTVCGVQSYLIWYRTKVLEDEYPDLMPHYISTFFRFTAQKFWQFFAQDWPSTINWQAPALEGLCKCKLIFRFQCRDSQLHVLAHVNIMKHSRLCCWYIHHPFNKAQLAVQCSIIYSKLVNDGDTYWIEKSEIQSVATFTMCDLTFELIVWCVIQYSMRGHIFCHQSTFTINRIIENSLALSSEYRVHLLLTE